MKSKIKENLQSRRFSETYKTSGNVMKEAEEKLIFNIFQDFLSNRKNYLKNAQMQKLDLINVVNHIKDFIKERFEIKDDDNEEMDEDLDPFIVETFQFLNDCLKRPVEESCEKIAVPLENLSVSITNRNKNAGM